MAVLQRRSGTEREHLAVPIGGEGDVISARNIDYIGQSGYERRLTQMRGQLIDSQLTFVASAHRVDFT